MKHIVAAGLAALCMLALAVAQDKRYIFFGKFKWGQDNDNIYMTVYAPGVSVEDAKISISRDRFSMEASLGDKTVDIEFDFREDVDPDDITIEPWYWLAGREHDSIMFQIPKVMPHYFDRLTAKPYTKEFKKTFEIDWNRYKRDNAEEEMNFEEADEEEWLDDDELMFRKYIKALTDDTFNQTISEKDLVVVHATYPWCPHCRDYLPFLEAVKLKKLRKKVRFASVDGREQRQLARQLDIPCEKPLTGQKSEHVTGCNRSLYIFKSGEFLGTYDSRNNDTDPERLVRYLQAMAGPFPKRVKQMSDLDTLKKDYELTTVIPVGIFDPAQNAEEFALYTKYAEDRRGEGRLFAIVDVRNLTKGLPEFVGSVLPDLASQLTTPAILLIKNFGDDEDDEGVHVFGGGVHDEGDKWTNEKISDFLSRFKYRLLGHYGKESVTGISKLMGDKTLNSRGLPVVHLWLDTKDGNELLMSRVRQAAMQLSRRVSFVYHDQAAEEGVPADEVVAGNCSEIYATELLAYGLDCTKRPVMGMEARGFSPFKHRGRYVMKETIDKSTLTSEIVSWCESALEEKLPLAMRTEPMPNTAEPGHAQKIVHSTFKEHIMDSPTGLFVNMFNYQSALYKAHTPELKKAASVLHTIGSSTRVLQYDYNRNEMLAEAKELEMIKRFTPVGTSLNFYVPGGEGGKKVERMHSCDQGDCSAESMLEFMAKHAASEELFDLEAAKVELKKLERFNPPAYKSACGRGAETCDAGYTCEYSICYKEELSFDLTEPLRTMVSEVESSKEL